MNHWILHVGDLADCPSDDGSSDVQGAAIEERKGPSRKENGGGTKISLRKGGEIFRQHSNLHQFRSAAGNRFCGIGEASHIQVWNGWKLNHNLLFLRMSADRMARMQRAMKVSALVLIFLLLPVGAATQSSGFRAHIPEDSG